VATRKSFASEALAPSAVGKADKNNARECAFCPKGFLLHRKSEGISYVIKGSIINVGVYKFQHFILQKKMHL